MFNPRKTEIPYPAATGSSVDIAEHRDVAASVQSTSPSKSKGANHSIVDERLTMRGDLESDGDVLVKGKVIGNIKCKLLIVDNDALVEGGIEADEVIIRGRTKGSISAERVRLERTAEVDSEISHATFSAEEGARIKGTLKFKQAGELVKHDSKPRIVAA